jgi:citrate synthase
MEGGMKIIPGLEGVVFTKTYLSAIDEKGGKLSYCGYEIVDLT